MMLRAEIDRKRERPEKGIYTEKRVLLNRTGYFTLSERKECVEESDFRYVLELDL